MKKDPISTLAAGSPLQKVQHAMPATTGASASSTKAGSVRARGRREPTVANGKAANGKSANGKGANGAPSQPGTSEPTFDTQRVLSALISLKKGDFDVRLPVGWTGIAGKVRSEER